VPIAATMNCDTGEGTDSRDGPTSVHRLLSSDISSQSSDYNQHSSDDNHYSSDSSSHTSTSGSHSSIPDLLSSTTASRDGGPEDEVYEAIIDVESLEPVQHADVEENSQQEEWYVDTGYINKNRRNSITT
jgi:hypothetical protein